MNIEAASREWEAECWEQYNHEDDYDELLEYSERSRNENSSRQIT